ncbi:MAG: hypothetical protein IH944_02760 [Armatimonadetes bacterium]|nr:hypothetical protein [Armatimonadota bacterium]
MTFTYNAFGQITTLQDGPTLVTYTYDDNGNQTTENRGGVTTGYVYDDDNHMKKITHSDATITAATGGVLHSVFRFAPDSSLARTLVTCGYL